MKPDQKEPSFLAAHKLGKPVPDETLDRDHKRPLPSTRPDFPGGKPEVGGVPVHGVRSDKTRA